MHFTSYRTVSTMQLQIDYGTQSNLSKVIPFLFVQGEESLSTLVS